jgi:hypothetical protein
LRLSLEDKLDDGKKRHEEDEYEDDDEKVDGNSIIRFDDSGDRNPEDYHSKNLKRKGLNWVRINVRRSLKSHSNKQNLCTTTKLGTPKQLPAGGRYLKTVVYPCFV